jgi:hypothetical protein
VFLEIGTKRILLDHSVQSFLYSIFQVRNGCVLVSAAPKLLAQAVKIDLADVVNCGLDLLLEIV